VRSVARKLQQYNVSFPHTVIVWF